MTSQSRSRYRSAKRSRWAHCNTPAALRRRRAAADARREALAATLPPIPDDPAPGSVWQRVVVYGSAGQVMREIVLYVPAHGRCDQHADASGRLLTATQIGAEVAAAICKRPSYALREALRREEFH